MQWRQRTAVSPNPYLRDPKMKKKQQDVLKYIQPNMTNDIAYLHPHSTCELFSYQ